MREQPPRVVLLARPGEACGRLEEALREAGAEITSVIDPTDGGPEQALAARPQAVLVALDPLVEEALQRFDVLLSDPAITVIFDEAELAAQREGWDAARWVRHLSAKLHRHDDVLPPGGEVEADMQPSPGPLQLRRPDIGEVDLELLASEALEMAAEVPTEAGFDALDASLEEAVAYDCGEDADSVDDPGLVLTTEDMDWSAPLDFKELPLVDGDFGELLEQDEATTSRGAHTVFDDSLGSTLSLADDDTPTLPAQPDAAGEDVRWMERDLEEIDRSASGLELADTDSYGHGPLRGVVLVEGGLGGPDAVRQLLASIPEAFPRPVLVCLHLDGGRYDRLVKQMQRAARVPVALAEAGHPVEDTTIYFLSPTLSVVRQRGRLVFAEGTDATQPLLAQLPGNDSAVLFLSGSDPSLVETAMAQAAQGALVMAQIPDSCYDGTAATALIERGGSSGTPAELVERLLERWPS
jgi:chemosensory pili system protein ChpB (putative protein-glutamate methylesterase)